MHGVPIRFARRGDIPSLLMLWEALMRELARTDVRLSPHARARDHQTEAFAAAVGNRLIYVAEENERLIVGFVSMSVDPPGGPLVPNPLGRIHDCYVVPPRRRQGIGRRLAGRALDLLFERGAENAQITVPAHHTATQAFWHSLGWRDRSVIYERNA